MSVMSKVALRGGGGVPGFRPVRPHPPVAAGGRGGAPAGRSARRPPQSGALVVSASACNSPAGPSILPFSAA